MYTLHCDENGRRWVREANDYASAVEYAKAFGDSVHINICRTGCHHVEYVKLSNTAYYFETPRQERPFWTLTSAMSYAKKHNIRAQILRNGIPVHSDFKLYVAGYFLRPSFKNEEEAAAYAKGWLKGRDNPDLSIDVFHDGVHIRKIQFEKARVGRMDSIAEFLHKHEGFIEFDEPGCFTCEFLLNGQIYRRSFKAEVTVVPQLRDFINEVLQCE